MSETRIIWQDEDVNEPASERVPELDGSASSVVGQAGEGQPTPSGPMGESEVVVEVHPQPPRRGRPRLQVRPAYVKFKAPQEHVDYLTHVAQKEMTTFSDVARVALEHFVITHKGKQVPVTRVGVMVQKNKLPEEPQGLLAALNKRKT